MTGPAYCGCCGGKSLYVCDACSVTLASKECSCLCHGPGNRRLMTPAERSERIVRAGTAGGSAAFPLIDLLDRARIRERNE